MMNVYVYDAKREKTEMVSLENSEFAEYNEDEFFEDNSIRKVWHSELEEWYLSIFDVVKVLTDSKDPKQYIKKMRTRDKELESKWGTIGIKSSCRGVNN